jgi:hypothetical protein
MRNAQVRNEDKAFSSYVLHCAVQYRPACMSIEPRVITDPTHGRISFSEISRT